MREQLPDFSRLASLLSDAGRAKMLSAMMGGELLTATQLAGIAGLSAQSASNHLAKLIWFRVVSFEKRGRNRYYRIYSHQIAQVIESMMVATYADRTFKTRLQPPGYKRICYARSCYDHLAGRVGVAIFEKLLARGVLVKSGEALTLKGRWFEEKLGINTALITGSRRIVAAACMDWSEQRFHLAGILGAALLSVLLDKHYLVRGEETRVLLMTESGRHFMRDRLHIDASELNNRR